MKNQRLEDVIDMSRQYPEGKTMIRVFCDAHGVTSAGHLYDVDQAAFDELYDALQSMIDQLGE